MKDHLTLSVDNLVVAEPVEATEAANILSYGEVTVPPPSTVHTCLSIRQSMGTEEEPLIQMVECRICQEEDNINNLESPCACTGSLKHAHRVCVQRWCDEKEDVTCEICHESYKGGYTALPRVHPDETTIDISGGWTITGTAFDLRDPRILAMAQNHIMEAEYDDYSATNASTTACCRSAALVLMALLLLRHALMLTDKDEDDTSTMFSATFSTACRWVSATILHHGLGNQYLTASETETGSGCFSSNRGGIHSAVRPRKRRAFYYRTGFPYHSAA